MTLTVAARRGQLLRTPRCALAALQRHQLAMHGVLALPALATHAAEQLGLIS